MGLLRRCPDMSRGHEPGCIIQRAGLDVQFVAIAGALMGQACAAGLAECAGLMTAFRDGAQEDFYRSVHLKVRTLHPQAFAEGTRGLLLALGAVAQIEDDRRAGNRVAHGAALAAASEGQGWWLEDRHAAIRVQ